MCRRQRGDGDLLERCRAYAPLLRDGDVFGHATAALLWGAPLPTRLQADATLHITATDGATRPRSAGVAGHAAADAAIRIRSRHSLPVVDPVSAWLQLAPLLGPDDLVAERGLRIGFGDLVYPTDKVLVEYEGEQHRTDSTRSYCDFERHEQLARAQWLLIRESKETPLAGPRSTTARARRALLSRGARL